MMRITMKCGLALLVAVPVTGFLVLWLGVIDIRASTGHWKITEWVLHFAMRSSIRTAALSVSTPDPDMGGFSPQAAVHFEAACATCHGSPATGRSPTALAMLPPPPDLATVVATWSDKELFEIVQHGVRYTGMPAWPAHNRQDEVWAMVAFLRALPDMDATTYRDLVTPAADASHDRLGRLVAYCDTCHADVRLTGNNATPRLNGQSQAYLVDSLKAYADQRRESAVMATVMTVVSQDDLNALASHYASKDRSGLSGSRLQRASPDRDAVGIVPCDACHGLNKNEHYPAIGGQSRAYLEQQLKLFAAGTRGNTPYGRIMQKVMSTVKDDDITLLADHFSKRPPATQ